MGHDRKNHTSVAREPPRLDGVGARTAMAGEAGSKRERDWKRSVLIGGLGTLSWVATYVGMLELIEANMGSLPLIHKVIIGFSVAMLMIMIIWLLDQLFRPHPFIAKLFYGFGYIFLSLISVGFGFGFYWKVLESRGEASRSAESAVGAVQSSLQAASTRLEQLQATLVQLTQVSNEKSEVERAKGTSCPNSKPGDGPRRKLREEDAQRFQFSSDFVKGRVGSVKSELSALNDDMIRIVSDDPTTIDAKSGTRNEFLRSLSRKLDLTVTGFNAFRTDPQLKQMRTDLADRAERTTFADSRGGTFACPDSQLQTALRGVVKAIDQLPELEKPQIAAVEGSEATIEAFRRLTATFYGALSFKMPPSSDEMRELQKKAVQSVESPSPEQRKWSIEQGGLSKRDYVPLAVALFVDLCLFLVSMVQVPRSRLAGLVPKMQSAESGPVIDILSRFNDIHKDKQIRENFEIFRHVVFDMNGDYYVAVPLDAPPRLNPAEREELRIEAQLLANLFASFEKERIFKRTMLPTTGSVQKRLKRQGSKFAGSESFRVYKFTDGAWSDIILGAVMGAAKRVENESRSFPASFARARPLDAVESDTAAGPMLPPAENAPAAAAIARHAPIPASLAPSHAAPNAPVQPATVVNLARNNTASRAQPDPVSRPGVAVRQNTEENLAMAVAPAAAAAPARPYRMPGMSAPSPRKAEAPSPDHVARFGPYATIYPQGPTIDAMPPQSPRIPRPTPPRPEAEVTVKAANSNTLPAALAPANPAEAKPQPAATIPPANQETIARPRATAIPDPERPMVDVKLARETATFSIPMSEATSASLKEAIARATTPPPVPAPVISVRNDAPKPDASSLALVPLHELEEPEFEDVKTDPLSERDLAIISRMAPPAAE